MSILYLRTVAVASAVAGTLLAGPPRARRSFIGAAVAAKLRRCTSSSGLCCVPRGQLLRPAPANRGELRAADSLSAGWWLIHLSRRISP